jgi:hypothetical protein
MGVLRRPITGIEGALSVDRGGALWLMHYEALKPIERVVARLKQTGGKSAIGDITHVYN